jgi:hypothetical protein
MLETIFETGGHLRAMLAGTKAEHVLAMLEAGVPRDKLPSRLSAPQPERLRAANRLLERIQVNTLKPEFQPKKDQRGARWSPWRAAVEFAGAFGLTLPAKKKDARVGRHKRNSPK